MRKVRLLFTNPRAIVWTSVGTPTLGFSSGPGFSLFTSLVFYPVLGFSLLLTLAVIQPLVFHFLQPWLLSRPGLVFVRSEYETKGKAKDEIFG